MGFLLETAGLMFLSTLRTLSKNTAGAVQLPTSLLAALGYVLIVLETGEGFKRSAG